MMAAELVVRWELHLAETMVGYSAEKMVYLKVGLKGDLSVETMDEVSVDSLAKAMVGWLVVWWVVKLGCMKVLH
jgi:hypothetical protein